MYYVDDWFKMGQAGVKIRDVGAQKRIRELGMSKLGDVNTTDTRDAIGLGCQTMRSVFDADDDNIPFFNSQVLPEAGLSFSTMHSEAHVPGRHLNALLNAEDAVGIALEESAVENHAKAAFLSYSGPFRVPLNRQERSGDVINFSPHNIREGFHALYALAAYRDSEKAMALAEASIEEIFRLWEPEHGWDVETVERLGLGPLSMPTFIVGLARAIGPLVKLYRATGCEQALDLAVDLKDKAVNEYFQEDGVYDRELFGTHTHSTTCVMSSLAQLAELTSDAGLMDRVRAFFDNGLWDIRDELGWVMESSGPDANPDRGEVNNTGDIVETALILGRWGYPEYYQDAERILRGHLLPSQLRDVSFIREPANPKGEDGKRDVAQRHIGAFGFPAPYGHHAIGLEIVKFNMDIVGGTVGSLCEAYREIVRSDDAGHWVNLLFDHETPSISVESPYTHQHLRVQAKLPGPLFVRMPSWVERDEVRIDGTRKDLRFHNGYLLLTELPLNQWISIEFPLPENEIVLKHRTRNIRAKLRGDAVIAMDNFGADLTFFDPY